MSWTDDRVALLTKLWTEGKTAAEIAGELGGVTRNAVIGKAHRLKLSNRVSPIQQNKKAAPAPKKKAEQKTKPAVAAVHDSNRETVNLIDLGARQCRWPIGDPQEASFGFCGCQSLPSLPYCLEHSKVAYQAATRNRILKTKEAQEVAEVKDALAKQPLKKAANQ